MCAAWPHAAQYAPVSVAPQLRQLPCAASPCPPLPAAAPSIVCAMMPPVMTSPAASPSILMRGRISGRAGGAGRGAGTRGRDWGMGNGDRRLGTEEREARSGKRNVGAQQWSTDARLVRYQRQEVRSRRILMSLVFATLSVEFPGRLPVALTGRSDGEDGILDQGRELERFLAGIERRAFRIARIALRNDDDALDAVRDAMFKLARSYGRRPPEERPRLFY